MATNKVHADKNTRNFYLAVATLVLNAAVTVFSVCYSTNAKHTAESAYAQRVELLEQNTNDNSPWSSGGSLPLTFSFSKSTGAIGIRRQVKFQKPFETTPQVGCAIAAVNMANLQHVFDSLGFRPTSANGSGLEYTSFRVDAESRARDGFELRVSVPMRTEAIEFLQNRLYDKPLVDRELADYMRANGEIQDSYENLTRDEIWMLNFHRLVGTFDVTCSAQAETKAPEDNSRAQ